jgi:hypothetical protein
MKLIARKEELKKLHEFALELKRFGKGKEAKEFEDLAQDAIEMPEVDPDDFLDSAKRDRILATINALLMNGLIDHQTSNAIRANCKEIRDNIDVTKMTVEVDMMRREVKDLLARKGRVSVKEIEELYERVLRRVYSESDDE